MLRSNTQSCTPNGGRTLQTFMLMAYTRLGSCGEQQDKPGSRSCSLRYQPFLCFLQGVLLLSIKFRVLTFLFDRVKTSWWLRTNLFCVHSSAQHQVSLLRGKSDLFFPSNFEPYYAQHWQLKTEICTSQFVNNLCFFLPSNGQQTMQVPCH